MEEPMDVALSFEGDICRVTLNSPATGNALTPRIIHGLTDAVDAAEREPRVRAIVLGATGRVFCAGADVKGSADREASASAPTLAGVLIRLTQSPLPVIGAIDGAVRGGGLGLVAACDIAVSSFGATYGFSEVRLGVAPAIISPFVKARVRPRALAELFLTGETFDGRQAAAIGLVSRVVESEQVGDVVARIASKIRLGAPEAVAFAKQVASTVDLTDIRELERRSLSTFASAEAQEGMRAFNERRAPAWAALDPEWPRPGRWDGDIP